MNFRSVHISVIGATILKKENCISAQVSNGLVGEEQKTEVLIRHFCHATRGGSLTIMEQKKHPLPRVNIVIQGWIIGFIMSAVAFFSNPLRVLRLPGEWVSGLRIKFADKGLIISFQPGMFDASTVALLLLSIAGMIVLVLLAAYYGNLLGANRKPSMIASTLALLLSFYVFLAMFERLFNIFDHVHWFSDLRFSPGFIFNLHFATLTAIFSQRKTCFQNWILPVGGYFLTFTVAMVVQQELPGTGIWPILRGYLQSPLAWVNTSFFLNQGIRHDLPALSCQWHEDVQFRRSLVVILIVNGLTTLLAAALA